MLNVGVACEDRLLLLHMWSIDLHPSITNAEAGQCTHHHSSGKSLLGFIRFKIIDISDLRPTDKWCPARDNPIPAGLITSNLFHPLSCSCWNQTMMKAVAIRPQVCMFVSQLLLSTAGMKVDIDRETVLQSIPQLWIIRGSLRFPQTCTFHT